MEQFRDDLANGGKRYIRSNFNSSNGPRQNEMNLAVANFLVVLNGVKNFPHLQSCQIREFTNRAHDIFNAGTVSVREPAHQCGNASGGDHPISDGFTMFDAFVISRSFDTVTYSVAKIKDASQISFSFVAANDACLDFRAGVDKVLER